ncbi:MAG: hypothetical protein R6U43_10050 [Candidatus Krumholzibacteriales bacterium]
MTWRNIIISSIALALAISGCGEDSSTGIPGEEPDTMVTTFRDGVSPFPSYRGTRDAVIKDAPAEALWNLNWGGMESDTIGSIQIESGRYQRRLLVRMDISEISACQEVLNAELTLHINPVMSDSVIFRVFRAVVPENVPDHWTEGEDQGQNKTGVSWQYATVATPWDNEGGDYLTPYLDSVYIGGDSTVTFSLPPSMVEDWIKNPLYNDGVLIKSDYLSGGYKIVYMRENSRPDLRPELRISYLGFG